MLNLPAVVKEFSSFRFRAFLQIANVQEPLEQSDGPSITFYGISRIAPHVLGIITELIQRGRDVHRCGNRKILHVRCSTFLWSRWPELNRRPTPSLTPLFRLVAYKRARLYLELPLSGLAPLVSRSGA